MPNTSLLREVVVELTDLDERMADLRESRTVAFGKAAKDGWDTKVVREAIRRRKRKQFEMFEDEVGQVLAALGE